MRTRPIFDAMGLVLLVFSIAFLAPTLVGLYYHETLVKLLVSYLAPMVLTANFGILFWLLGRIVWRRALLIPLVSMLTLFLMPFLIVLGYGDIMFFAVLSAMALLIIANILIVLRFFEPTEDLRDREAFFCVGVGWLVFAFFGALPYVFSGTLEPIDAYFESMSGFATCGSTVINNIEALPHSLLLWRSITQWLGGMGIIVFSVVILARILGVGGAKLFGAEMSGLGVTRLKPRIKQTASILWKIYVLFTVIQIIALLAAGMDYFDAVNHSFTSIATGGFSTKNTNIAHYDNPWIESVIVVFMLIGATSFALHYRMLTGNLKSLVTDPEFRFYIFVVLAGTALTTISLLLSGFYKGLDALRFAIFQVVSINTASGFSSADFAVWPAAAQFTLLLLMFVGGCVGSTAGGIKVVRCLILLKTAHRGVKKVTRPRAVIPITLGRRVLSEDIVKRVGVFFFLYILIFVVSSFALTFALPPTDTPESNLITAMSAVATTMGTVGPGLGAVGPMNTFAFISPAGKLWLALCMWLGRLEIFTGLILLFPETYKR